MLISIYVTKNYQISYSDVDYLFINFNLDNFLHYF